MIRSFLALFACVVWLSFASAQITIPDSVDIGKPIVAGCDCVIPEAAETRVSWFLESMGDGQGEIAIDTGSNFIAYVWAEPGKYKLTNSVMWVQTQDIQVPGVDGEVQVIKSLIDWGASTYEKQFDVIGVVPEPIPDPEPNPEPGPNPGPNPGPSPDVPSDQWDLGKTIYAEAMKLPAGPRAKANDLADNFDAVSAGIAAGQFRNGGFNAASAELASKNRATLGSDKDAWDAPLSALFSHMQAQRVPTTLQSYADAYTYIANGLRAVK
jgi:hypothetical protein